MQANGNISQGGCRIASAAAALLLALACCIAAGATTAEAQDGNAAPGDVVEYRTAQKVGVLKEDVWSRYASMEMECLLPPEVEYISASVVKDGAEDVTSYGTVSHDPSANRASFSFSSDYLASGMALAGETYELVVTGKVTSVLSGGTLACTSRTRVDGVLQDSNEATAPVKAGVLEVSLEAADSQVAPLDEAPAPVGLKAVVTQSVDGAHVRDAKLVCTMPEGVRLDPQSVSVTGADDSDVAADEAGFFVRIDWLDAGTVEVAFCCLASSSTAGTEIGFTATASAYGVADADDEAHVESLDASTPRSVTVSVTLDASTLHQGHGAPAFVAILEREGSSGAEGPWSRAIAFDEDMAASGEAAAQAEFGDLAPGKYSLRVVAPSRYSLASVLANGEKADAVSGAVQVDAVGCEETFVELRFEKTSYQYLSSTDFLSLDAI